MRDPGKRNVAQRSVFQVKPLEHSVLQTESCLFRAKMQIYTPFVKSEHTGELSAPLCLEASGYIMNKYTVTNVLLLIMAVRRGNCVCILLKLRVSFAKVDC